MGSVFQFSRFNGSKNSNGVRGAAAVAASLLLLAVGGTAKANLTIVPTFDTSINNDPNAAAIKQTINTAISTIDSYLANNVQVNITFVDGNSGLGSSDTFYDTTSYSTYLSGLETKQTLSSNDVKALASLGVSAPFNNPTNNPVNGNPQITASVPLLRVLGYEPGPGTTADSTITFNGTITNDSRTGPQNPNNYDLQSTIAHEIDEVLGIGGAGSTLAAGQPTDGPVGVLDLYRYSAAGVRSYTTSQSIQNPYFSIDGGTTGLVHFNQDQDGTSPTGVLLVRSKVQATRLPRCRMHSVDPVRGRIWGPMS